MVVTALLGAFLTAAAPVTDPTAERGAAALSGASVRRLASGNHDVVLIDAPKFALMHRLSRSPVFLNVPLALTWGGSKDGVVVDATAAGRAIGQTPRPPRS